MGFVEQAWVKFRQAVIETSKKKHTEGEVRDLRSAFYAGAGSLFFGFIKNVSDGTGEPTPEDMALMTSVDEEFREYVRREVAP